MVNTHMKPRIIGEESHANCINIFMEREGERARMTSHHTSHLTPDTPPFTPLPSSVLFSPFTSHISSLTLYTTTLSSFPLLTVQPLVLTTHAFPPLHPDALDSRCPSLPGQDEGNR